MKVSNHKISLAIIITSFVFTLTLSNAFGAVDFGNNVVGYGYDWIKDYDGQFKPFRMSEDANIIQVETKDISYVFDKTECAFSIFKGGAITPDSIPLIPSDSFTFLGAVNGSDNFVPVNQINNAFCNASVEFSSKTITVSGTKHKDGVGTATIKLIKKEGQDLKSQIEVTNLNPSWNNHNLGIIETIHVPQFIKFGGQVRDLSNYDGQFFDRDWIKNNKAELVNLADKLNYDVSLGFKNLRGITVVYENNQAKLALEYTYTNDVILPTETFILDPTYPVTDFTQRRVDTSSATGGSCPTAVGGSFTTSTVGVKSPQSTANEPCRSMMVTWDLFDEIPSGADVDQIEVYYDWALGEDVVGANCDVAPLVQKVQDYVDAGDVVGAWADIHNGTDYITNNNFCHSATPPATILLNFTSVAQAITDLENGIDNGWWGFGIGYNVYDRGGGTDAQTGWSNWRLNVTYSYLPDPVHELTARFNTPYPYSILLDWLAPESNDNSSVDYRVQRNCGSGWTNLSSNQSTTTYTDSSPCSIQYPEYRVLSGNDYGWNTGYTFAQQGQEIKNAFSGYDFDYDFTDKIGNNDGTLTGTQSFINSQIGNTLNFTGVDYVTLANESNFDFEFNEPFSISVWVYPYSTITDIDVIIAKDSNVNNGASEGYHMRYLTTNNRSTWSFQTGSGQTGGSITTTNNAVPLNTWTHIIGTFSGNSNQNGMKIYVNGLLDNQGGSQSMTGTLLNNESVRIGTQGLLSRIFDGMIDQPLFFDYELSAQEALKLFEQTQPINPNPLTHIPFENNLNDIGVLKNNGTITGNIELINGINGLTLNFTGDDYVTLPNESDYDFEHNEPFSISAWVYPDSTVTNSDEIIAKGDLGLTSRYGIHYGSVSQNLGFRIIDSTPTTHDTSTGSNTVPLEQWSHIVATYSGNSNKNGMKVYVNSTLVATGSTASIVGTIQNNEPLIIGSQSPSLSRIWNGMIDEPMIFQRELTQDEITNLFNEQIETLDQSLQDATVTTNTAVIGDVVRVGTGVTNLGGFPSTANVINIEIWNGTSLLQNVTGLSEAVGYGQTYNYQWSWFTIDNPSNISTNATLDNGIDTMEFQGSVSSTDQQFQPTLFTAVEESLGLVNYTLNENDPTARILTINRPIDSGVWNASCKSVTGLHDQGLQWQNVTNQGWFNQTFTATTGANLYVTCYNPDHILFSFQSYGNSTGLLAGLAGTEGTLGTFFGLPLVFMFVLFIASLYSGNRRGMGLLVTMMVIGILSALGAFVLEENIWGLVLSLSAIGLFALKQWI